MMARTRISIAKPDIVRLFSDSARRIHRKRDLARIFSENRAQWRLTQSQSLSDFVKYLLDNTALRRVHLALPHRAETLYTWGEVSVHQVALAAKDKSYLSHYTAMALHELTSQVPKTIYVNVEQRPQPSNPASLTQERIDNAFKRPQRKTTNIAEYKGYRLTYVNGKYTGQLGVIDRGAAAEERVRVTGIERTLVDVAVRPSYAGGVAEVLGAYRAARARDSVSVNRLAATLTELSYVYPYEQVIGFYLEKAGFKPSLVSLFRSKPFAFDFYLDYAMKGKVYVPDWRLYVPKGL